MPRAPKQCGRNGCTNVIRYGQKCPDHPHGWKGRPRTASSQATTTWAWKKLHDFILKRDGYDCQIRYPEHCTGYANTVDKIIPATRRPDLALDPANLRAACAACNGHKARTEDRT